MSGQHLIDHAEFDTAIAAGRVNPDQQSELDEFVKNDLMKVIDDVFDEVERNSRGNPSGLTLERLEIDLGEIALADYRQQMSQRLRRQLSQALNNARYTDNSRILAPTGQAEATADESLLFYYLRYGYLPWNAAFADADGLEAQLQQVIETSPASLVEFFDVTAQDDEIIDRLKAQFSAQLVERVIQLLESSHTATAPEGAVDMEQSGIPQQELADTVSKLEERQMQLETLLAAGEQAPFHKLWLSLVQDNPEIATKMLRNIANQAPLRQKLARLLSARQFAELVRRLLPNAHGVVLPVLEHGHWSAKLVEQSATGSAAQEYKLREYLLGYLLVESGARFDPGDFVESLLSQVVTTDRQPQVELWSAIRDELEAPARADGISAELARLMLLRVEKFASRPIARWADEYQRYARIEALFTADAEQQDEALILADIDALLKRTPWLLQGLFRELQTGSGEWHRALRNLSAPVLEKLGYSFMVLLNQSVAPDSSAATAAIRRNLEQARHPQAYYADILIRLISGEAINFEAIGASESNSETGNDDIEPADSFTKGGEPGVVHQKDDPTRLLSRALDSGSRDAIDNLSQTSPRMARMLQYAELLVTASLTAGSKLPRSQLHAIKWRFVESYAIETGNLLNPERFLRGFVANLIDQAGVRDANEFCRLLGQALVQNSLPSTRAPTREIIEQLDDIAAESQSPVGTHPVKSTQAEVAGLDQVFDQVAADEDIHIANAGLVLLAPWLPRLFDHLGFVEEGVFKDRDTAERAVHCLQFLVDASLSRPEYQLVLNKILCGVKPGQPIRRRIELSANETEQLESLLDAITQHWKALENTSIDGLRESFLQRGGRLQRKGDAWHLAVETRAFDMLLDQVPWSYSTIKFGWMERVIYVDWR